MYGLDLEVMGKQGAGALVHFQRAVELDPLNLNALSNLGADYTRSKQLDRAIEQLKKVLEIDSTFANAHDKLAAAYFFSGKYDLWLEEEEKGAKLSNDSDWLAVVEATKREYPKSGYRGATKAAVALEEEQAKRIYIDPAWIAGRYAVLGEKDHAFAWLEKAYAENSGFLAYLKCDPFFDSLRSDPRYADLLKRMGLPK